MVKKIGHIAFLFLLILSLSCEKDEFVGPPIENIYGSLEISQPLSNDKPVGVDFSI